ncbi:hypothetical protein ACTL6U_05740 [Rhodovibrionaceae bacterium A322]
MLVRYSDFIDEAALRDNPAITLSDDLSVEREFAGLPKMKGVYFTASHLFAGFVDTYNRMEVLYNLIEQINDISFQFPAYQNPHCRELDFFELYGLSKLNLPQDALPEEKVDITINEFAYYVFLQPEFFKENVLYDIHLNDFKAFVRLRDLSKHVELDTGILWSRIDYRPDPTASGTFSDQASKVVLHLRRGDTLGKIVDPKAEFGTVQNGMATFPVLRLCHVPAILKDLPLEEEIEIILVSDGISSRETNRFRNDERILEEFAEISREMVEDEIDMEGVTIIKRLIGREPQQTIETMTHIYEADYVIAMASSFSSVPARLGGTKFVFARNYIEG